MGGEGTARHSRSERSTKRAFVLCLDRFGRQRRGFICSSDGENEGLTPVPCCEGSRKAGAAEVLREKKSKHKWLRLEEEEEEEEEDLDLVQLLSK